MQMLADVKGVKVAQVDCVQHKQLCNTQNIRSYPSIRLYPSGPFNSNYYQ